MTAGHVRLIRQVQETPAVSQQEIDYLYEQYRYGSRPTFYIYLLPETSSNFDPAGFQDALDLTSENEGDPADEDDRDEPFELRAGETDRFDTVDEIRLS